MLPEPMLTSAIAVMGRVADATCVEEGCLILNEGAVTKLPDAPIIESCPGTE
jgi:hypothetical protein